MTSYLFDQSLLNHLEVLQTDAPLTQNGDFLVLNVPNLQIRPLERDDFDLGYMELLKALTVVGSVTKSDFEKQFDEMKRSNGTYYIVVVHDKDSNCIAGSASLVVERKFLRQCNKRGHIEDVVVLPTYQGRQLGKAMVRCLTLLGQSLGCYKISLDCQPDKMPFYEKLGFRLETQCMMRRFEA